MATFVYNFKSRFADLVACGCKRQTVRAHRKDNRQPKAGDTVKLYTGLRMKGPATLLGKGTITRVEAIVIDSLDRILHLDGEPVRNTMDLEAFAHADGFKQIDDMFVFFGLAYGQSFEGVVIHWEVSP